MRLVKASRKPQSIQEMVHVLQVAEVKPQGVLTKRLTLIIKDGKIVECFYPVFPSDSDAAKVVDFLKQQQKVS